MCGRFNLIATKPQIMAHFDLQTDVTQHALKKRIISGWKK